jgi:hypothetical protein
MAEEAPSDYDLIFLGDCCEIASNDRKSECLCTGKASTFVPVSKTAAKSQAKRIARVSRIRVSGKSVEKNFFSPSKFFPEKKKELGSCASGFSPVCC